MIRLSKEQFKAIGNSLSRTARKASGRPAARRRAVPMTQESIKHVCAANGLPKPIFEHPFAPWEGGAEGCGHPHQAYVCGLCGASRRRWRFDWCFPEIDLAIEIQGGVFTGGRHVHASSIMAEYEKLNNASICGWFLLLVTPKQVQTGEVFALIRRFMEAGT